MLSSRLASLQWITQLIFSDNYLPADSDLSRSRYCYPTFKQQGPGVRFSKVPIVNGPRNLFSFIFKIEILIVLCRERNLIKLSGNNERKKRSVCLPGLAHLFLRFGFEYFGPEQSLGLSRYGPLVAYLRQFLYTCRTPGRKLYEFCSFFLLLLLLLSKVANSVINW